MNMTLSLPATVSARDIQRRYTEVFSQVNDSGKPVVVVANNQPVVAIISLQMLEEYTNLQLEQRLFRQLSQIQKDNQAVDQDKAFAEITSAVEETRQKLYDQNNGRS